MRKLRLALLLLLAFFSVSSLADDLLAPVSDPQKTDWLWKKLQNIRYTTTARQYYDEDRSQAGGILLQLDDLFSFSNPPPVPAAASADITLVTNGTMTEDIGEESIDNTVWCAGGSCKPPTGRWIEPRYDNSYSVVIKDANNDVVPPGLAAGWFFDYRSGLLVFNSDPTLVDCDGAGGDPACAIPFTITAYRFSGKQADQCSYMTEQGSTPPTPASGIRGVYTTSTGLFTINSAGAIVGPMVDVFTAEEESQIGTTTITGNAADDQVLVGTAASAATWITLPDSDLATQKLQYDQATNAFSAGTDDDVPEAGDFGALALTGDVTSAGLATTIANNAVTNAKLADVPTATFKGRTTAGTSDPEDLTVAQAKTLLNLTGTNSGDQTITLTGDVTGSGTGSFAATIAADSVALTTDTTGNYLASSSNGSGITGASAAAEGGTIAPAFDYTATLAGNPAMNGGECRFSTTGLICEGATGGADNIETLLTLTDPTTSDKTITLPNASGTVAVSATSPITLSALGNIGFTATGFVTASGSPGANQIPKFTSASDITSSTLSDDGTDIVTTRGTFRDANTALGFVFDWNPAVSNSTTMSVRKNGVAQLTVDSDGHFLMNPISATAGNNSALFDISAPTEAGVTTEKPGLRSRGGTLTLTGTYGTQRFNRFGIASITAASPFTVTDAATVAIEGAPTQAGSATVTNKYSLWVQGGESRLAGNLGIDPGADSTAEYKIVADPDGVCNQNNVLMYTAATGGITCQPISLTGTQCIPQVAADGSLESSTLCHLTSSGIDTFQLGGTGALSVVPGSAATILGTCGLPWPKMWVSELDATTTMLFKTSTAAECTQSTRMTLSGAATNASLTLEAATDLIMGDGKIKDTKSLVFMADSDNNGSGEEIDLDADGDATTDFAITALKINPAGNLTANIGDSTHRISQVHMSEARSGATAFKLYTNNAAAAATTRLTVSTSADQATATFSATNLDMGGGAISGAASVTATAFLGESLSAGNQLPLTSAFAAGSGASPAISAVATDDLGSSDIVFGVYDNAASDTLLTVGGTGVVTANKFSGVWDGDAIPASKGGTGGTVGCESLSGSNSHGAVLFGVKTATSASWDTGNEVCAGNTPAMTCVTTADVLGTPIACGTAHTLIDQWLAFCK